MFSNDTSSDNGSAHTNSHLRAARRAALVVSTASSELQAHEKRLWRTEERLAKLVEFIVEGNASSTVASTVRNLEAQAQSEKVAIAAIRARAYQPRILRSPDAILASGPRLQETLEGEPVVAREPVARAL